MKWIRWGAIGIIALVAVSAGLFTLLVPPENTPDSANPPDVIERVSQADSQMENLVFNDVSMIGDRVLVQSEYSGDGENTPRESAQWHALAEETANRLYQDYARNRGVEVRIYQGEALRGVAVAGL